MAEASNVGNGLLTDGGGDIGHGLWSAWKHGRSLPKFRKISFFLIY